MTKQEVLDEMTLSTYTGYFKKMLPEEALESLKNLKNNFLAWDTL